MADSPLPLRSRESAVEVGRTCQLSVETVACSRKLEFSVFFLLPLRRMLDTASHSLIVLLQFRFLVLTFLCPPEVKISFRGAV